MIQLRDYQKQAVLACLKSKSNYLVVLPTGTGKTEVFIELTKELINRGENVIVIIDKLQLLKQTIERFTNASIVFDLYHGNKKPKQFKNNVLISTVRTLYNATCDLSKFGHVIVDEVHHITATENKKGYEQLTFEDLKNQKYKGCKNILDMTNLDEQEEVFIHQEIKQTILEKLLKKLDKQVYGFTATPIVDDIVSCRGKFSIYDLLLKHKQCICSSGIFKHENVYYKSIAYMINQKYLCDFNIESWDVDTNDIFGIDNFRSVNYESLFDPKAKKVLIRLLENIIEDYQDNKTLVFLPDINKINYVKSLLIELLPELENHIKIVHQKTDKKEEAKAIEDFKDNESDCKIILNCMKLTEGFDSPNISRVFIIRACRSIRLFIQIIGRALRLDKNRPNKIAKVYDYSLFAKEYHNKYLKHTSFNYKDTYTHCLTFLNDTNCSNYKFLEIPNTLEASEKVSGAIEYVYKKPRVNYTNTFTLGSGDNLSIQERYRIDFNYIPYNYLDIREKYYNVTYNFTNDIFLMPLNHKLSFNVYQKIIILFNYEKEELYFIWNKKHIYTSKIKDKKQLKTMLTIKFIQYFLTRKLNIEDYELVNYKFYKREVTEPNLNTIRRLVQFKTFYTKPLSNYCAKKLIALYSSIKNMMIVRDL